eukprot:jgi/Tetstr1/427049/TSEL_017254.t1
MIWEGAVNALFRPDFVFPLIIAQGRLVTYTWTETISASTAGMGRRREMAVADAAPMQIMRLSSAEDAEVKVGGPLTHARLCTFYNTECEAVQGMNVRTCLEDAEDSTEEGYEACFVCHWVKQQLAAAEFCFAAGNMFQHPNT